MPRHPNCSSSLAAIGGSVFSSLADRIRSLQGEVYPLHVGDTWMEPAEGCRMEDLRVADYPGMHRYSLPQGMPPLLSAIADRVASRTGIATRAQEVLVAAGATGALGAVVGAIVEPGEEVLILAPHWPLIAGIVRSFRGIPVPVPFIGTADSPESAVEVVSRHAGSKTVALYLNSPNNPTGAVIPPAWLEALLAWAESADLWILADEVYEDYAYNASHTYTRSLAAARTFSVHSFSKAYGMAGNRCGYVVGPAGTIEEIRKVSTHTFYSTPTASQIAALRVLEGRADRWLREARMLYERLGNSAADRLGVPRPQGGQFLFVDVSDRLDERGLQGFLEDCVDKGLLLAPGPSFGPYPHHVRICFTAAEPAIVERGVEVFALQLGR